MIVEKDQILAFSFNSPTFAIIDLKLKKIDSKPWPQDKKTSVLGACMCPSFHFDELSFIFVRDESTIKLINTQNWVVSELVEVGESMKYPDLQLL